MSSVKKGTLARASEWAQHLRPWGRRIFWKRERVAQAKAAEAELVDSSYPDYLCGCGCGNQPDQCRQLDGYPGSDT